MRRRLMILAAILVLLGAGAGILWRHAQQRALFLPEAENDFVMGWVAGGDFSSSEPPPPSEASQDAVSQEEILPDEIFQEEISEDPLIFGSEGGIQTTLAQPVYPVGTTEIVLSVYNPTDSPLEYTDWFDFRRMEGKGTLVPLDPLPDAMPQPDQAQVKILEPGETVELTVPIDIFPQPLTAGIYRVAQLTCYANSGGHALACTEITADFILE